MQERGRHAALLPYRQLRNWTGSGSAHVSHNLLIGSFIRKSWNTEQNAWQEWASKLSFWYFTRCWKRRKCSSAH